MSDVDMVEVISTTLPRAARVKSKKQNAPSKLSLAGLLRSHSPLAAARHDIT